MLKFNGIWPKSEEYYKFSGYFCYQLYYQIALSVHFFSNLIEIIFCKGDFNDKLLSAVLFPEYFICLIKRQVHSMKWKTVVAILKDLNREELQPRNAKQMEIFNNAFKLWTLSFNLFFSMQYIVSFFFLFQPYFTDSRSRGKLIFPSWYPVDVSKFPFYDIVHFYQMYAIFLAAMSTICLDSFCGALMTYVAAECDILCDTLENLYEETKGKVDQTLSPKIDYELEILQRLNDTLNECVIHHKIILRLSRKVSDYLNLMVMSQCFVYVSFASFALFALTVVQSETSKFIMGMSLLLSFIQLFQYCWMGNEVLVKVSSFIPVIVRPISIYNTLTVLDSPQMIQSVLHILLKMKR
ncbi:hypothetical protein WA026_001287 [Henosepilachna vigintioctopunctata]|uniref:Odorant receptor n=1 Tax=Henosepilachna vigintioctopunctata TaxID=420089 RepID=A0AAW1UT05_9CUCU